MRHAVRMPVIEFQNRNQPPLELTVWPSDERHEIPHLATVGIRYELEKGAEDRSCCSVSNDHIDFWCAADTCEIEIVHPSAFDKLLWDICANGGWCGGIVDGEPTHVEDLLPETGVVTARDFAEFAIRADGWSDSEPLPTKHLLWLEAKFVEHLGAQSVNAENLCRNLARPFEEPSA